MTELARIQQQCTRVERTLTAPFNGEIELLRTARVLRRIHGNLRSALILYVRRDGWTQDAGTVQATLDGIEADLRHVLLGYPQVKGQELRAHVQHALQQSIEALELLSARCPSSCVV